MFKAKQLLKLAQEDSSQMQFLMLYSISRLKVKLISIKIKIITIKDTV
jgi:hypothetical protein